MWEGWRIDCRLKDPAKLNIIFILLRRKFIPPFYDTYCDILLMLKEPYKDDNYEIREESNLVIETIADSLFPTNVTSEKGDYTNVLESKLEAMLLDEESVYFFYNILGIYGKETYKIGLDYVYKFLTMMEEFGKEKISPIKKSFEFRIQHAYKTWNEKLDFEAYEKAIKDRDLDYYTRKLEKLMNVSNSSESQGKLKIIWENKMWRYLSYCLNGGLTNNLFNIQEMIALFKKISTLYNYHVQINNMLNLRIMTYRNEMLDPKISSVLNSMGEIKFFDYNEEIMAILIRTGYLKILQGVENDMNYATFIKFLLDNNPSLKLLNCLSHYLKEISKSDSDNNLADAGMRKSFNTILSSLMGIYANGRLCPLTLATACKCLVYLTCTNSDKNNKNKILQEDALYIIAQYLDNPDEKILFFSLELLQNLLPELQDNLHDILYKNNKLIPGLLNILEGPNIAGAKYSIKHSSIVITILINLIKMQKTLIQEKLSSEENRHFLKHLKPYIEETKLDKGIVGLDLIINLQERVFIFLDHLLRKNFDIRRYMRDLKYIELLEAKCKIIREEIKKILKAKKDEITARIGDLLEPFLKLVKAMLAFMFYYIGHDKEIMAEIQQKPSIIGLIQDVMENKSRDIIHPLNEAASSINLMLNPEENEDEN